MSNKTVTITGGSGFVGRILQAGLREQGYPVVVFDQMRGPLVDFLRGRRLGTSTGRIPSALAGGLRRALCLAERALIRGGAIRRSSDDILDLRSRLAERFRGSDAVIHLAGLPHPKVRGASEADYRRINFEGSINVFEAAREAGVRRFIFASSGQVYGINKPVRIDQFPILETNYCPAPAEGQNLYGFLKREFERYLEQVCRRPGIQAVSLRLEFPGVRSRFPWNFYISTSIENTVAGFIAALEADLSAGFEVFNLADRYVDERIVDIQEFLKRNWPDVPNYTTGNECLLSTEKARSLLGSFQSYDHDLVTSHIRRYAQEPGWLEFMHQAQSDGWRGYPEVSFPTLLLDGGFRLLYTAPLMPTPGSRPLADARGSESTAEPRP